MCLRVKGYGQDSGTRDFLSRANKSSIYLFAQTISPEYVSLFFIISILKRQTFKQKTDGQR